MSEDMPSRRWRKPEVPSLSIPCTVSWKHFHLTVIKTSVFIFRYETLSLVYTLNVAITPEEKQHPDTPLPPTDNGFSSGHINIRCQFEVSQIINPLARLVRIRSPIHQNIVLNIV